MQKETGKFILRTTAKETLKKSNKKAKHTENFM